MSLPIPKPANIAPMAVEIELIFIPGLVVPGHQVASGANQDSPYHEGTLALQAPHFLERGLDISRFHRATINVDFSPLTPVLVKPSLTLDKVDWTDLIPPETFSFLEVTLARGEESYSGLLYYPHPETKVENFQSGNCLEFLATLIPGLSYSDPVRVGFPAGSVAFS